MLSETHRREIDEQRGHYADVRAVIPEALKVVQRDRGWVSDEDVRDIADYLDLTIDEVDGVATFYNLIYRKPVGRHVILVCDSVSCWVMESETIQARLKDSLGVESGGTTDDGRFTLLPCACLGACDRAPALMIDEDLHGPVSVEDLDHILQQYE